MRQISAGLLILPLLAGLGVTIGSSDLLYPTRDDEFLATARVGAWLAGAALVVFFGLEAFPADRRGASGLILAAAAAGTAVAIGHDIRAGMGLSPVVVFFVPAVIFAMSNLFSFAPVEAKRTMLAATRRKLAVIGCATGFVAAYMYFMAGTRGLVMDFVMLGAAVVCAIALLVCALVVWPGKNESSALVTVVAVAIGLITLRDYFIWQAAVLGGSAYLSHRLTQTTRSASVNDGITPLPPRADSPTASSG
jgi:hypothetical protein